MVFDNHPQNMYNQQNMSSQQNMHTQQNMYNSKQDNVIHSNVQQSKTKNKVNESQRSYMFPESDIFEEKFDNLSNLISIYLIIKSLF